MGFLFWKKKPMLDDDAQQRIVAAIKQAESNTTGELRLYMEHHCSFVEPLDRAKELFEQLGMFKTQGRNAIIVYVAFTDRQFAIFGDVEIYHKAGGAQFWEKAAEQLKGHLKKNQITEGLCNCISELGRALAGHFPFDPAVPRNELPDEIVFGK